MNSPSQLEQENEQRLARKIVKNHAVIEGIAVTAGSCEQRRMTMESTSITRRLFLIQMLTLTGLVALPSAVLAQTPGMSRREDRRVDRADRTGQRADNMAERSDDPLGVRGVNRREDRRDGRQDRRSDRRDRVF